jgi:hypothetical protein
MNRRRLIHLARMTRIGRLCRFMTIDGFALAALSARTRVGRAEARAIITTGFQRPVFESQEFHEPAVVHKGKIRPMLRCKDGRIRDPVLVDTSKIWESRSEFHDLPINFTVSERDLISLQKQDPLIGGATASLGIFVRSAFSMMASRLPGILSRDIRQLPGIPGRCIVRSVIGNARGPFFALGATDTM